MVTQEHLNQVLPTFPNDEQIRLIDEALKSGKHHVIVTRMGVKQLDILSTFRKKYIDSDENTTDYPQMFFPEEEGITLADLTGHGMRSKEVREHTMMVTRISKSRMSDEQIVAAFLPDPNKTVTLLAQREKLLENGTLCFIHPNDAKGWKWVQHKLSVFRRLSSIN